MAVSILPPFGIAFIYAKHIVGHLKTRLDILTVILTVWHGLTLETPELTILDSLLHR